MCAYAERQIDSARRCHQARQQQEDEVQLLLAREQTNLRFIMPEQSCFLATAIRKKISS